MEQGNSNRVYARYPRHCHAYNPALREPTQTHFSHKGEINQWCLGETMSESFVKPWLPKSSVSRLLFSNAKVIDVVEGNVYANSSVILEHGTIAAVAYNGDKIEISGDIQNTDLHGKYICPGLIDSLVHIAAVPGSMSPYQSSSEETAHLLVTFSWPRCFMHIHCWKLRLVSQTSLDSLLEIIE